MTGRRRPAKEEACAEAPVVTTLEEPVVNLEEESRTERLLALRRAIASGEYRVDAEAVAERLMATMRRR